MNTFVKILLGLVVLPVLGLVLAKSLSKNEGRIVGGEPAEITELPHQVWLGNCGGSILNKRHILTAAHCLEADMNPKDIRPLVGTKYYKSGGKKYQAKSFIIHPDYDELSTDIAVIELTEDLEFSDNVQPIKLADSGYEVPDGAPLVASGWGFTEVEFGEASEILMKVEVPKVNWDVCNKAYYELLSKTELCAGIKGKDSCRGDSGGPLIQKTSSGNILVGVVSWGHGCGRDGYPGVYAGVAAAREWIDVNSKII